MPIIETWNPVTKKFEAAESVDGALKVEFAGGELATETTAADTLAAVDGLEAGQTATNEKLDDIVPDVDAARIALQAINAKTPDLHLGRTSDGGIIAFPPTAIVAVSSVYSAADWYGTTTTGGGFVHDTATRRVHMTVDGTSGASSTGRSKATLHSTPARTQSDIGFQFDSPHAQIRYEIGIVACDVPLRGLLLAELNGAYSIRIYDNGAFTGQEIPVTPPYVLHTAPHRFRMQTVGSQMSNGATRIFVDDTLLFEAPASATTQPLRQTSGLELYARVTCLGAAASRTMGLGSGAAYAFANPAYPVVVRQAERGASLVLTGSLLPLVVVRGASPLGRPTVWPKMWTAFFTANASADGRFALFYNESGVSVVTGGSWVLAANGRMFDYNASATAFNTAGLEQIGEQVPIGPNAEGLSIVRSLADDFHIGGRGLTVWPNGFTPELALMAVTDAGSATVKRATIGVEQPMVGP